MPTACPTDLGLGEPLYRAVRASNILIQTSSCGSHVILHPDSNTGMLEGEKFVDDRSNVVGIICPPLVGIGFTNPGVPDSGIPAIGLTNLIKSKT